MSVPTSETFNARLTSVVPSLLFGRGPYVRGCNQTHHRDPVRSPHDQHHHSSPTTHSSNHPHAHYRDNELARSIHDDEPCIFAPDAPCCDSDEEFERIYNKHLEEKQRVRFRNAHTQRWAELGAFIIWGADRQDSFSSSDTAGIQSHSAVFTQVAHGNVSYLKLANAGGSLTALRKLRGVNQGTLLHVAVANGHAEMVRYLLTELRCDPHVQDATGNSPWTLAVDGDSHVDVYRTTYQLRRDAPSAKGGLRARMECLEAILQECTSLSELPPKDARRVVRKPERRHMLIRQGPCVLLINLRCACWALKGNDSGGQLSGDRHSSQTDESKHSKHPRRTGGAYGETSHQPVHHRQTGHTQRYDTALLHAARCNLVPVVELLLSSKHPVDIEATDGAGAAAWGIAKDYRIKIALQAKLGLSLQHAAPVTRLTIKSDELEGSLSASQSAHGSQQASTVVPRDASGVVHPSGHTSGSSSHAEGSEERTPSFPPSIRVEDVDGPSNVPGDHVAGDSVDNIVGATGGTDNGVDKHVRATGGVEHSESNDLEKIQSSGLSPLRNASGANVTTDTTSGGGSDSHRQLTDDNSSDGKAADHSASVGVGQRETARKNHTNSTHRSAPTRSTAGDSGTGTSRDPYKAKDTARLKHTSVPVPTHTYDHVMKLASLQLPDLKSLTSHKHTTTSTTSTTATTKHPSVSGRNTTGEYTNSAQTTGRDAMARAYVRPAERRMVQRSSTTQDTPPVSGGSGRSNTHGNTLRRSRRDVSHTDTAYPGAGRWHEMVMKARSDRPTKHYQVKPVHMPRSEVPLRALCDGELWGKVSSGVGKSRRQNATRFTTRAGHTNVLRDTDSSGSIAGATGAVSGGNGRSQKLRTDAESHEARQRSRMLHDSVLRSIFGLEAASNPEIIAKYHQQSQPNTHTHTIQLPRNKLGYLGSAMNAARTGRWRACLHRTSHRRLYGHPDLTNTPYTKPTNALAKPAFSNVGVRKMMEMLRTPVRDAQQEASRRKGTRTPAHVIISEANNTPAGRAEAYIPMKWNSFHDKLSVPTRWRSRPGVSSENLGGAGVGGRGAGSGISDDRYGMQSEGDGVLIEWHGRVKQPFSIDGRSDSLSRPPWEPHTQLHPTTHNDTNSAVGFGAVCKRTGCIHTTYGCPMCVPKQ